MTLYAEVILSLPLQHSFTYLVPPGWEKQAEVGSRVLVPFKERKLTGFIINLRKRKLSSGIQLKEISEVLDERPVFSSSFLSFTRKLSEYYLSSWGEILQASLPPSFLLKTETKISLTDRGKGVRQKKDLAAGEKKILNLLQKRPYTPFFLRRKLKLKNLSSLLSRLEKKGLISVRREVKRKKSTPQKKSPPRFTQLEIDFSLDRESSQTAQQIAARLGQSSFSPFLLFGEGRKREGVYFYLIKRALQNKKKVLFLVPEISLTQAVIEKFEKRLGRRVACLHSRLSEKKREAEWKRIKEGEAEIVVGPRSTLLSPLQNIGLIIVDQEQDESYSQQESPQYDTRIGARLRAKQERCVLVWGSSFPTVESFYRAKKKGFLLPLFQEKSRRKAEVVDERKEREVISPLVKERIEQRLERKEPILVFVNRRGYASFLFCARCSHIPRCRDCDISLTYHKKDERLVCHYCQYSIPRIDRCPRCGAKIIRKRGLGIELIEEELKRTFPQSTVLCFDTDVTRTRKEQERILGRFLKGKIDILVGTQLLAHQVDLPLVSLVAVLHPETTLTLPDFRASQRTFQNLNQMKKFAHDGNQGEVIIQTSFPHHFSIRCAAEDDYESFYKQEIKFRRLMNYPPFSYLAEILFQGNNLRTLAQKSREFSSRIGKYGKDIEILGPALASVARVRGMKRVQLVLKAKKRHLLQRALNEALQGIRLRKSVFLRE
ncbi:MAG: primosomal protein N' [Candidatus Aminicenantes bacterium]